MKNIKDFLRKEKVKKYLPYCYGFIVGVVLMLILYPDRIAKLSTGEEVVISLEKVNLTADEMYDKLKEHYSLNAMLELIDTSILSDRYEIDEEDMEEIEETANSYYEQYESYYGITKEEFLENNGFDSEDDFFEYLKLDKLRSKYQDDYFDKYFTNDKLEDFYNSDEFFTPFTVEHILVETDESEEDAESLATEILNKLKSGSKWDDLKTEYEDSIVTEELTVEFDSNYEEDFTNAASSLSDGKYTTSLVETSYGYHIIYRTGTLDKPTFKEAKEDIKEYLISEYKSNDTDYYQKILVSMREEAGLDIKDTVLKKIYNAYAKSYK